MDFLINGVSSLLNTLAKTLPSWTFVHNFATDVTTLIPYFQKAAVLVPIDTVLTVLALVVGLELVLIALYWIDRVINLLRGAG